MGGVAVEEEGPPASILGPPRGESGGADGGAPTCDGRRPALEELRRRRAASSSLLSDEDEDDEPRRPLAAIGDCGASAAALRGVIGAPCRGVIGAPSPLGRDRGETKGAAGGADGARPYEVGVVGMALLPMRGLMGTATPGGRGSWWGYGAIADGLRSELLGEGGADGIPLLLRGMALGTRGMPDGGPPALLVVPRLLGEGGADGIPPPPARGETGGALPGTAGIPPLLLGPCPDDRGSDGGREGGPPFLDAEEGEGGARLGTDGDAPPARGDVGGAPRDEGEA